MKFGVALPTGYEGLIFPAPFASPESMLRIARAAEDLGYDSVMPNDHYTTQDYVRRLAPKPPNFYDPLVSLSFVAAATTRLKLITGVMVMPLRNPVVLAKQAVSLHEWSGGRLILGVGVGAYREEFEAVAPDRRDRPRGELLEEGVRALRLLFAEDEATFRGEHWRFENVQMYPKPEPGALPLWIGGNAVQHYRRVARWGDGWLPAVLSPDEVARGVATLKEECAAAGRPDAPIEVAPQLLASVAPTRAEASAKLERSHAYQHLVSLQRSTLRHQTGGYAARNLVGGVDEIRRQLEAYRAAGVTQLPGLIFAVDTVDEFLREMEFFATRIMTEFAA
jgi:probable F420-dependent oxidoreductase